MQIKIHLDRCIGAGHCVLSAPDVFTQNDSDGVVVVLDANPPPASFAAVREAARKCPTAAIELVEAD